MVGEVFEEEEFKSVPDLKPAFVEIYKGFMDDYDEFVKYSSLYIRKSIRVNTLKASVNEVRDRLSSSWLLEPVPWCEHGFWISYKDSKRFDVGNVPEHQLGYVYVQDAASMIPPVVLNPRECDLVLDLCAAPGSKTTQLAQLMNNKGLLVANDSQGKRLSALGINLQRCGVTNTLVTKMHGERIRLGSLFDKVLVDAPCSGTGTIRRSYKIVEMWSPGLVDRMSKIQFNLLKSAFRLLKKGGFLVYSTCTLEPQENEGVISKFLEEFDDAELVDISLDIKRREPIMSFNGVNYVGAVKKCLRIHPQDNDTEGFFVAKIRKV